MKNYEVTAITEREGEKLDTVHFKLEAERVAVAYKLAKKEAYQIFGRGFNRRIKVTVIELDGKD
ncbi:MAG TPA: hypothetical protein VMW91_04925 [Desulfosporosinus sp.]|nr:hypothetical protein [Desulfosporosinus sp.]